MLSRTPYGMAYPFGQLGSAVPAASAPSFLGTPSLLAGGVGSALFSAQIQNTAPYQLLWRKLTLPQPKPAHCCLSLPSPDVGFLQFHMHTYIHAASMRTECLKFLNKMHLRVTWYIDALFLTLIWPVLYVRFSYRKEKFVVQQKLR